MSKKKLSHLKVDLMYYKQITALLDELMGLTDEICDLLYCSGLNSGMFKYFDDVIAKQYVFQRLSIEKVLN